MPNPTLQLPRPPKEGTFVEYPEVNFTEFKGDVGSGIRRQQYTGMRDIYEFDVILYTKAEKDDIKEFFKDDCAGGSLRFDTEDIESIGDSPPVTIECSWIDPPRFQRIAPTTDESEPKGGIYVCSFRIAKEPA